MFKPIRVSAVGLMAATMTSLIIAPATAYMSSGPQGSDSSEMPQPEERVQMTRSGNRGSRQQFQRHRRFICRWVRVGGWRHRVRVQFRKVCYWAYLG